PRESRRRTARRSLVGGGSAFGPGTRVAQRRRSRYRRGRSTRCGLRRSPARRPTRRRCVEERDRPIALRRRRAQSTEVLEVPRCADTPYRLVAQESCGPAGNPLISRKSRSAAAGSTFYVDAWFFVLFDPVSGSYGSRMGAAAGTRR